MPARGVNVTPHPLWMQNPTLERQKKRSTTRAEQAEAARGRDAKIVGFVAQAIGEQERPLT